MAPRPNAATNTRAERRNQPPGEPVSTLRGAGVAGRAAVIAGAVSECDESASRANARSRVDWKRGAGFLFQTTLDDAGQRWRNVSPASEVGQIILEDRRHRVDRRVAPERTPARQHFVQHDAEGEDVRAMVSRKAAHLLRGHVADGAEDRVRRRCSPSTASPVARAGRGRVGLRELGETEVEDFDALVGGDEDVFRLQVAMDDALVVRGGKPAGELHRVRESLADKKPRACRVRNRPLVAGRKPVAQRLALEQLRDDVRRAVVLADVVDIQNVRMVQRGRRARLLLEAGQTPAIPGECGR